MGDIRDAANQVYSATPGDEPDKADIRTLFGTVEDQITAAIANADAVVKETWTELDAVTGQVAGKSGRVYDDAGTHTDPISGDTVDNEGIYVYVVGTGGDPTGWRWYAPLDPAGLSARVTEIETVAGPAVVGFGQRIIVDRAGELGLAQTVYLPRRFYIKQGSTARIFSGATAPGTNSSRLNGFHEVTYASTTSAYLIYFDAATGTAHASRFKSVAYSGTAPDLDSDCFPIMVIDNGVVVAAWFTFEYASEASATPYLYRPLVLDGSLMLAPAGLFQTETSATTMTAPSTGMFRQEVTWPPSPGTSAYTLYWDYKAYAAGSDPWLVATYPKRPDSPYQIPVARYYNGRTTAVRTTPIIGDVPSGRIPNLMAVGQNDVEDADLVYGSSDPCDIDNADLVALGFTRGYNNSGATLVYYGTKLFDYTPGRWAFVRVYIQTGVDNAFGTPSAYFVTPTQTGNDYFALSLEKKLSNRAAIYSGWAQMDDDAVYTGIWVGSYGFLTTDDVRICGVQIGYGAEHMAWVSRSDFPSAESSAHAKLKAAYAAAEAQGITDGPEILYPADMWMIEGRPQQIFVPNLFEDRTEGGSAKVTFVTTPRNSGEQYQAQQASTGSITIDPDRVGRTGQIVVRKTLADLDDRFLNSVTINVAPRWTIRGATPKLLFVGDSLTYQTGVPVMVKRKLTALNITPTFVGTLTTVEDGVNASTVAEGRPGVEAGQLINATVPNATVTCAPLAAGSETAYTTTYTETQRREANPFVRLTTGGDDPTFVYNGWIVDIANYISRFSLSTPDYLIFSPGTNDVGHATDDTELEDALDRFEAAITIFTTQMIAANSSAKVAIVCHPLPRSVAGDARWEDKQVALIKRAVDTVATLVAAGKAVKLLPGWAHASLDAGWSTTAGTTAYGQNSATLDDTLHYEGVASDQIAEMISAWIACQEAGTTNSASVLGPSVEPLNPNADFQVMSGNVGAGLAGTAARMYPFDNMGVRRTSSTTGYTVYEATNEYGGRAMKVQRDSGNSSTNALNVVSFINANDVKRLRGKKLSVFAKVKAGANFSPTSGAVTIYLHAVDTLSAIGTDGSMTGTTFLMSTLAVQAGTAWKEVWAAGSTDVPSTSNVIYIRVVWTPTGTAGADDSLTFETLAVQESPTPCAHRSRLYALERRLLADMNSQRLTAVTNDTTFTVPAGYMIESIAIRNTTANAVTGGIKIGTTSGGTDVVAAQAVGASALVVIADAAILLRYFSATADTTLYLQDVTAWNSASLEVWVSLRPAV
jgi:hypothetical protein